MKRKTVAVINYGSGNLRSVSQALEHAAQGTETQVVMATSAQDVLNADRLVLPGQGHIATSMHELRACGLLDAVLHAAAHKPLLGVCVGMQLLLERSEEGPTQALGLIPGEVVRFDLHDRLQADGSRFKVPQMGWNQVCRDFGPDRPAHPLWQGIAPNAYFYFVHSYFVKPTNPLHTVGQTDYGGYFASAIAHENIFATQFHPEKSATQGLALYRNFLHWNP